MKVKGVESSFIEKNNAKFFTNDKVILGSETCERISSPANTRTSAQEIFKVPIHTIGTKNLFIYISGKLKIPNIDYEDINSEEVKMFKPIEREESFDAVLVSGETSGGGGVVVVENNWEDF